MSATIWGLSGGIVAVVLAVVFVGTFFQATAGFGFSLLAVPLLSLVMSPRTAVVLVFFHATLASLLTAHRLRRDIDWTDARWLSVGAIVAMPLGVVVLLTASPAVLRFGLGTVTCAAAVWMIVPRAKRRPPLTFRPAGAFAVGALSGVLNTSLSTNGPPLVLYLRARGIPATAFRSTLSTVFTLSNVIGLALLVAAGAVHQDAVRYFVLSVGVVLFGWWCGNLVAGRLRGSHFTTMVDALLFVSGALAIARALTP